MGNNLSDEQSDFTKELVRFQDPIGRLDMEAFRKLDESVKVIDLVGNIHLTSEQSDEIFKDFSISRSYQIGIGHRTRFVREEITLIDVVYKSISEIYPGVWKGILPTKPELDNTKDFVAEIPKLADKFGWTRCDSKDDIKEDDEKKYVLSLSDGDLGLLYLQSDGICNLEMDIDNYKGMMETIEKYNLGNDFIYNILKDYDIIEDLFERLGKKFHLFEEFSEKLDSFIEKWQEHATVKFSFEDGGKSVTESCIAEGEGVCVFGEWTYLPGSIIELSVNDKYGLFNKSSRISASMQTLMSRIQEYNKKRLT